jgi:hypothetical protein
MNFAYYLAKFASNNGHSYLLGTFPQISDKDIINSSRYVPIEQHLMCLYSYSKLYQSPASINACI